MTAAPDPVADLAAILGVPAELLGSAIGGPWTREAAAPGFGHVVAVFTGLANPRAPERPLVVLRVDRDALVVEVGRAVGVALPTGARQWSLGEPRASIAYDEVPLDEVWGAGHTATLLVQELGAAVNAVLDSAVLRGTTW